MSPHPGTGAAPGLGGWRAVLAIAFLAYRARRNRVKSALAGIGSGRKKSGRRGAPRKSVKGGFFLVIFGSLFLVNSLSVASMLAENLSAALDGGTVAAETGKSRVMGRFLGKEFRSRDFWPGPSLLPPPERRESLTKAYAVVLGLAFLTALLLDFGDPTRNPRKLDAQMEWLLSFPAAPALIFWADAIRRTAQNAVSLNIIFPPLAMYLALQGFGAGSRAACLGLALGLTLGFNAMLAGAGVAGEAWLRFRLGRRAFDNLRAACLVCGMLLLSCLMLLAVGETPRAFVSLASRLPGAFAYVPVCLPALADQGNWGLVLALVLASGVLALAVGAGLAASMTRNGLEVPMDAVPAGKRRGDGGSGTLSWSARPFFGGLAAKEARLLGRDRLYLVTIMVLPLLVAGFPLAILPDALAAVRQSAQNAAALAFSLGAISFLSSAYAILNVEQRALWLLFSFPGDVTATLLRKARLWAMLGLLYPMLTLAVFMPGVPDPWPRILGYCLLALLGTVAFAFIAAGLGVLATDPTGEDALRRQRLAISQLYTFMCGLFLYSMYAPGQAAKAGGLALAGVAAWAIWNKVRAITPYLLDPDPVASRALDPADAAVAAMAYFALYGMAGQAAAALRFGEDSSGIIAGLFAGGTIAGGFFLVRRRAMLIAMPGSPAPLWRALILAAMAGIAGAGVAAFLGRLPLGEIVRIRYMPPTLTGVLLTAAVLPALSEIVFRGVMQRGLSGVMPGSRAAALCAVLYASSGLLAGFCPMFIVGALAGWMYERTRRLAAAIFMHIVFAFALGFLF